jgi:hypothetical protein
MNEGVHPELRGSAVTRHSLKHNCAPDGSTVTETDVVDVERLGYDDPIHRLGRNVALLDEPTGAGVAYARRLLVNAAAMLDGALVVLECQVKAKKVSSCLENSSLEESSRRA